MAKLPILMYHNVNKTESVGLTISVVQLDEHFEYLVKNNYTSLHLSSLENKTDLPKKSVVITFDDVTVNQLIYAYPLLKKYNLKATFFVPFNYVGKTDLWNNGLEPIMNLEQLKELDANVIELAYHSFNHPKFNELSISEIAKDCQLAEDYIKAHDLRVYKALAYPYGKFPRKGINNIKFKELLEKHGYKYGLRIGNRLNRFPFNDNFEINRIDIKGEDTLKRFKLKLRWGKTKLF